MENKIQIKTQDARINVYDDHELQYWSTKFGVLRGQLRNAVAVVGPFAAKVEEYLEEKQQRYTR